MLVVIVGVINKIGIDQDIMFWKRMNVNNANYTELIIVT